jgi:bifunctional UDP-N-acetylglucosamine pyrophosphorylase/glucosamine-1-phosphate N-acetyltransferase
MEAAILAAGKGTRLLPLTETIPKAMVPVNGKPMLEILLRQLKTNGIIDVTIVVGYLHEKITSSFGDGTRLGMNIRYAEQTTLDGSARALLAAEKTIRGDKFLCICADSLFETKLLERLLSHKSDGVFTCKEVEDGRAYGILLTAGDRVTRIIEKPEHPPTNLANFSVYILPRTIFDACKNIPPGKGGEHWLPDAIQYLIDNGARFTYEKTDDILDIGTHEQLAAAQELAKELGL